MAQVRICDRCGRRITAYKVNSGYTLMCNNTMIRTAVVERNFDGSFSYKVVMDLCKECQESLVQWVVRSSSPYGKE